jgi:hypothetical protein
VPLSLAGVVRWTRTASRLAALAVIWGSSAPLPAFADVTDVDVVNAPIVRVSVRHGNVTIRTWERSTVEVDGDPTLAIERRSTDQAGGERSILIPQAEAKTAHHSATLPAESFVSAWIPPGERDLVSVHTISDDDVGAVTVTIPSDSVFVFAHAFEGALVVHDYRGGTFVGFAGRGRLALSGVGGTVFAQTGLGPLIVNDSRFDRLRARSLLGNVTFQRCNVREIEATAVDGSIVYDAGTFRAGLARFESKSGDVAVGAANAADLGGRATGGGHVYTNFGDDTPVDARDGETDAVIKGGGPVVTATSETGNVFLYEGSLHEHPQMPPEWRAPGLTLARPGARPKPRPERAAHFVPLMPFRYSTPAP